MAQESVESFTPETVVTQQAANDDDQLFEQSFFEEIGSPVDFDDPEWLAALLLLIPFYMIMRSVPPKAKEQDFPFIKMLFDLTTDEQDTDKMPWWQRAVNLAAVSAVAIAAAGPKILDTPNFEGEGPVLIAVDNGWASGPEWNERVESMITIVRHAHNDGRQVMILPTAPSHNNNGIQPSGLLNAQEALDYIERLQPQSWSVNHELSEDVIQALEGQFGAAYWLSNGLQGPSSLDFAVTLNEFAPLTVLDNNDDDAVHLILEPEYENGNYHITVKRSEIPDTQIPLSISAYTEDNVLIARQQLEFGDEDLSGEVTFDAATRNANGHGLEDVFRFVIDGEKGAGAVALVDEQWKPRTVGIAIQSEFDVNSLLGEAYYINIALSDQANTVVDSIESLIDGGEVSVLMVPDSVIINDTVRQKLENWVRDGGTLVRFAGQNLARDSHRDDVLLPVNLRQGTRALAGGSIDDDNPDLGTFAADSPFFGMERDGEVSIQRQILAQPGPETDERTWASLADGTPLVTANEVGDGQVILFHTTPNTQWSDLSLSPLFVDMLVGVVQQSNSVEDTSNYVLPLMPPISVLDGYGDLEAPLSVVNSISQTIVQQQDMGPLHPPGFYGNTVTRFAYNISDTVSDLTELGPLPESIDRKTYAQSGDGIDLKHPLMGGALSMLVLSSFILFAQQGSFNRKKTRRKKPGAENAKGKRQSNLEPNDLGL